MVADARARFRPASPRRWIAGGVVTAVLLGAGAVVLGRELLAPATADPPAPAASELVRFDDAASGISIAYPAGWRRISSSAPGVRLLAQGESSSMLVRTTDIGITVGPRDLDAAKKLTDALVRAAGQPKLLRPAKKVSLGGLPGYLYLYTFLDPATDRRGAHAHYFLFRGQTLMTIIFQTVPAQRFAEFAPRFDRIAETLQVAPGLSRGAP